MIETFLSKTVCKRRCCSPKTQVSAHWRRHPLRQRMEPQGVVMKMVYTKTAPEVSHRKRFLRGAGYVEQRNDCHKCEIYYMFEPL